MSNVYNLFREHSSGGSDFIRAPDGSTIATYQDLEYRSAQYANRLKHLGLSRGDRVMVQVEKSVQNLFLYFACLRAGLIYLPLNTAYRQSELDYFVSNASPGLIICSPQNKAMFSATCREMTIDIHTLDGNGIGSISNDLEQETSAFVNEDCDDDEVAVIVYTSGTTGQPKGAMISHGNLASNAMTLHKAWAWTDGDVMLHALPIFHIHGLFVAVHIAVLNASPIIFLSRFNAEEVISLLPASSVFMGVPTNYMRLLASPSLTIEACANMRLFTSGSAPLLPQTFSDFTSRTGHQIVERYGMTETGMNTSNPVTGPRKPGTVGPPLTGTTVRIVDQDGHETDQTGNLLVKGPNVFKGYWQLPEKTREEFTNDGYFKTGDLATIDEDGYVSIVGRNKDMIITGGLNVYPREIETVIDKIAGVEESAVIGLPHPDFGEAVIAVVVKSSASNIDEQTIIQELKGTVANYKVAKQIIFVDELPRNTMGKVQKNLLREKFHLEA